MTCFGACPQVVEPKRQKLKEAEETLEVVMKQLRAKQAELKEVLDKLAALDADLQVRGGGKTKLQQW
jgi:dynein heavy chain